MTASRSRPFGNDHYAPNATLFAWSPWGGDLLAHSAEIRQRTYSHEIALIVTGGDVNVDSPFFTSGAPVALEWATLGVQNSFYGYVSHVNAKIPEIENRGKDPVYAVWCVGATDPLKDDATRTFSSSTVRNAVSALFDEHQLALIGDADDAVWASLTPLPGESEWSFSSRCAKQIGFSLCAYGAVGRLTDLARPFGSNVAQAPIITNGDFRPSLAAHGLPERDCEAATYVAPFNGGEWSATSPSSTFGRGRPSTVKLRTRRMPVTPTNVAEAMAFTEGAAKLNAYVHKATLNCPGSMTMRPDALVVLAHAVTNAAQYAGAWRVEACTHTIDNGGKYTTKAEIARDSLGVPTTMPAPSYLPEKDGVKQLQPPTTVWRKDRWAVQWSAL